MHKGAIWVCHSHNPAKRAKNTSVLRVEVRIYTVFQAVINRKASMEHCGRLGWRDIPLSIILTRAFNVASMQEGSGGHVRWRILNSGVEVLRMSL